MIHQPASPFPSHFPASYDLIRDTSSPSNLSRSLSRGKSFANTIFNQLETTTTFDRNIFVKISTIQILQKSPKRQRHIEAKTRQFIKDIPNGDVKDTLLLLQTFISLSSIIEQLQWNKQKSAIMQKRKWIFGIWQRQDTVNLLKSWTKEQISWPPLMKITLERILCNYRLMHLSQCGLLRWRRGRWRSGCRWAWSPRTRSAAPSASPRARWSFPSQPGSGGKFQDYNFHKLHEHWQLQQRQKCNILLVINIISCWTSS